MKRLALGLFVVLTVLHTWPIATAPWRESLNWNADTQYAEYSLAWMARALARDPSALFDATIFAPEPDVLAYSEPVVTPAVAGAPLLWVGASPVLVYNLLLLLGLTLTATTTWHLVRRWTGSMGAGLVAGALAAYNVHLLTRLPHLMAAQFWALVLTLFFADRLVERARPRDAVLLALSVAATAANSLYALAFAGLAVAVTGLSARLKPRPTAAIVAGSLGGLLLASPVLLPYLQHASDGHIRPIEMAADFSASPAGYLTSTSLIHQGWSAAFFRDDVNVFFAGVTAVGLMLIGIVAGLRRRDWRRRTLLVIALAGVGVLLSLGPSTAAYRWLYEWFLPLQGLRATARFGYLYLLAVAILAGFGVAWIEQRLHARRAASVVAAILVLVTVEAWHGPVRTTEFDGVPPIYSVLAEKDDVTLVEVPFYPPDAIHENGPYVLNAIAHWQPVMNGHSGFTPMSYRERAEAFWFFPEDWAIDAIRDEGATHVMVHLELFLHEAPMVRSALIEPHGLYLVAADADGHLLYEVLDAGEDEPGGRRP